MNECSLCGVWVCRSCIKFNLNDLNTINRDDIFWACQDCLPTFKVMIQNQVKGIVQNQFRTDKNTNARVSALESKMDTFTTKLDKIIEMQVNSSSNMGEQVSAQVGTKVSEIVANTMSSNVTKALSEVSDKVSETVGQQIKSTWSSVVGDNPTANVTHSPEETKAWITKHSRKMVREIKREEKAAETRLSNLVIYGAPEDKDASSERKRKNDKTLVDNLMNELGLNYSPEDMYRMGKHPEDGNKEQTPENQKKNQGRILKVVFKSNDVVQTILDHARKLAHAPEELKALSLDYDMSSEEREILKSKLNESRGKN